MLLGTTLASSAAAQTPGDDPVRAACIAASDAGQTSRDTGHLRAARASFLACSRAECPKTVRLDCDGWLEETTKSVPSVVLGAADERGNELGDVRVTFDGEPLADHLTGTAVAVDPGSHVVRFQAPDGRVVEQRVLIREAEKARPLLVTFPPVTTPGNEAAPPLVPAAPVVPAASTASAPATRSTPTSTNLVVGSLVGVAGVASLATALYFETQQNSLANSLQDACPHKCAATPALQTEVNSAKTDQLAEGIFFGLSAATLAASGYVLLARPFRHVEGAPAPAQSFELSPQLHGGFARWTVRF